MAQPWWAEVRLSLVVCNLGFFKLLHVSCYPEPQRCDVVKHLGAEVCNGVFDPGRDFSKHPARDKSVALQSAECLG
jgi:hypothetical protein